MANFADVMNGMFQSRSGRAVDDMNELKLKQLMEMLNQRQGQEVAAGALMGAQNPDGSPRMFPGINRTEIQRSAPIGSGQGMMASPGEIIGARQVPMQAPQPMMDERTRAGFERTAQGGALAQYEAQRALQAAMNAPVKMAPGEVLGNARGAVFNSAPFKPDAPNELLDPDVFDAKVRLANATRDPNANAETWGNPVAEVGPDGKPIQVRYSNKNGREVVPGAVPAKQGNSFDRADYWRAQVKPFADSATNARVQASKVASSLALNTGTGHIAAINALQKMIDEGAVVRDQDVALIQSAQSLAGRLGAQMETLKSGKILSPELQTELQGVAGSLEDAIYQGVNDRVSAYEPVMTEEGVRMDSVLPPEMRKMFTPKPKNAKPPGAPENARQAKDGNWYSPDPQRPGKYVKW